jgi:hypothetical protein
MMSDVAGWNWQMPRTWATLQYSKLQRPQFGSVFLPYERFSQMSMYPQPVAPQQVYPQLFKHSPSGSNRKVWTA